MNEAGIRRALRDWVKARIPGPVVDTFDDRTPLIASRLITSLQVTDLLLFIEELRAASIDPSSLRPGVFGDIDTIYATFFSDPGVGGETG